MKHTILLYNFYIKFNRKNGLQCAQGIVIIKSDTYIDRYIERERERICVFLKGFIDLNK